MKTGLGRLLGQLPFSMHCVGNGSGLEQTKDFAKVFQGHDEPAPGLFAYVAGKQVQRGVKESANAFVPDRSGPADCGWGAIREEPSGE
jgi:hypothetical protein